MNSQQLLYINIFIVLFFVLYFFFFKPKAQTPTRLNLKAKPLPKSEEKSLPENSEPHEADIIEMKPKVEVLEPEPNLKTPEKAADAPVAEVINIRPKNFHVYFVYNGHEWECHEVLGIQPGAQLQEATRVFQQLIKTSDASTFDFYESAYKAILKKRGRRES